LWITNWPVGHFIAEIVGIPSNGMRTIKHWRQSLSSFHHSAFDPQI
jgi:hypothetical protein